MIRRIVLALLPISLFGSVLLAAKHNLHRAENGWNWKRRRKPLRSRMGQGVRA